MNKYNPNIHHRRSIRLKGYDYSQAGLYFITICCHNRECFFGKITVGASLVDAPNPDAPNPDAKNFDVRMDLNDAGIMIKMEWDNMKSRFPNIELHEYVVMPNHFHAILEIVKTTPTVVQNNDHSQNGQSQGIAPSDAVKTKTIGDIMDAFKSITTVEYIRGVKKLGWKRFDGKLWQRNYYEHIIRNEQSCHRISEYIINNPAKWADDKFHKK